LNRLEEIARAIDAGDMARANRLITAEMRDATQTENHIKMAVCHQLLGNVAEIERRAGDALRNWSQALRYYEAIGITCSAETERLRTLIRVWHAHQRVFVSYARADDAIVQSVLGRAREHGVQFETDTEFLAGRSIAGQIRRAIEQCPRFLVFFSVAYATRAWTQFELALYREKIRRDLEAHAADCGVIFICLPGWKTQAHVIEEFQSALSLDMSAGLEQVCGQLVRSIKTSLQ